MAFKNNLAVTYAGLSLPSPIVVASSGLTNKVSKLRRFQEAGAGAVVLKSVCEEQLEKETASLATDMDYPEAADYLQHYVKSNALEQHIQLIREAKQALDIPVIVSINCYKSDTWMDYATTLVQAGADALELNVMRLEADATHTAGLAEKELVDIVAQITKVVRVPVTVKLSKYFANVCALTRDLKIAGAAAVVLFNRLYAYDIDVEKEEIVAGEVFSTPSDLLDPLRFTALLRSQVVDMSIAISTGVRNGKDLVKCLLGGANVAQYCTAIYQQGEKAITDSLSYLDDWMCQKKYKGVEEFTGKLAATNVEKLNMYLRAQFMKYFSTYDETPLQATMPQKIAHDADYQIKK